MVTRRDVAERAGVSVTAVSRVINNSGYVEKGKREKILAAIREVGYCPRTIPVLNSHSELRQLLFLNRDLGNPFTMEMYRGIVDYAWEKEYIVSHSGVWHAEQIQSMAVSGIILSNEGDAKEFDKSFREILPLPAVAASYGAPSVQPRHIPYVESDAYSAMELLVQYLIKRGHRKIAFVSPFRVDYENPRGMAWYGILRPILKEQISEYIFVEQNIPKIRNTEEIDFYQTGKLLAEKMRSSHIDMTAVACFNEEIAIGVMHGFQEAGIRVPEDISIMGLDGLKISKYNYPRLTCVSLAPYEQGRECARILLDMLENKKVPMRTRMKAGIILEGDSVKTLDRRQPSSAIDLCRQSDGRMERT